MVNEKFALLLSVFFLLGFVSAIGVSSAGGLGVNLGTDVSVNSAVSVGVSNGSAAVILSNGDSVAIKVTSSEARQTAEARLGIDECSNCNVELVQVNVGSDVRAAYKVKTTKVVKILWIFRSNMDVAANVDVETGEVISVQKPWWAALSAESRTTVNSNSSASGEGNANTNAEVNNTNTVSGNRPLSEWCIKGQTYSVSQNASASSTVIEGIASYKGSQWCKGTSRTVIKSQGGYSADIEALTTYYFNEGGKEMWVSTNVNGQMSDVHVTNN